MNYLKQINGFWNWRKLNTMSHAQTDLYFALMDCANTALWEKDFSVPNSTLMNLCQISKQNLHKARNQLVQLGLINYSVGKKGSSGTYNIIPLYDSFTRGCLETNQETNRETNRENNRENTNKQNKNININININKKKNYRKNVIISDEEYNKLTEMYGKNTADMILDKLDNYKAKTNKHYADDFAAIKRWTAESVLNEQKSKPSVFCEEYDHEKLEMLTRKKYSIRTEE